MAKAAADNWLQGPPCEECGRPVNQNEPHVRRGIIHYFESGKMLDVKMWHLRCWDPNLPEYNSGEDVPVEYRS